MAIKRMMVMKRAVPEHEFQSIASANTGLVDIAKSLNEMASSLDRTDPEAAKRLRVSVTQLLDKVDTISESVIEATRLTAG